MDKVTCPVCHKSYKYINNFHLKTHGYSSEKEFKKDYPNAALKCSSVVKNIKSHTKVLNSNSDLQREKALKLWENAPKEFIQEKRDQLQRMQNEMKINDPEMYRRIHLYAIQGSRHDYKLPDGKVLKLRSFLECTVVKFFIINKILFNYESLRYNYNYKGKTHGYIPDFYLPSYDLIIEVKPKDKINDEIVQLKKSSVTNHRFMFISEDISSNFNSYLKKIKLSK